MWWGSLSAYAVRGSIRPHASIEFGELGLESSCIKKRRSSKLLYLLASRIIFPNTPRPHFSPRESGNMQGPSANVAIVGGGLAGLALALALSQVGIQSTVFEA